MSPLCRASMRLENEDADWCWNRPCKSACISLLHPLFLFVSFQMHSKRGSLIGCVYVGWKRGLKIAVFLPASLCAHTQHSAQANKAPSNISVFAWVFLLICKSKRITNSLSKASLPLFLLRAHFDAEWQRCQQNLFVL